MPSIPESTTNMDTDNKTEVFVKSLGEVLSKATNVSVFFLDASEQTPIIVDAIRNKLPAKSKQLFKDISDSQLNEQISEFLINYHIFTKEKSDENFLMALAQFRYDPTNR